MDQESTNLEHEVSGLALFVGEFQHALDPKKRLTIPSVWRSLVGAPKSLYVLPSFDTDRKCLVVVPASAMVQKLEALRRVSLADARARDFMRKLGAASDLVTWDTQGRIRIKDKLLDFAQLTDQVKLVGTFENFELWNPNNCPGGDAVDQAALGDGARGIGF